MGGETEQAPVTEMSGRVFDTQMTEEEYRLMEHVMEEEEKENEKDKLIMRKETRRARRILCAISRERVPIVSGNNGLGGDGKLLPYNWANLRRRIPRTQ